MSKNEKTLNEFVAYCKQHPELRFWQALVCWSGWTFLYVSHNSCTDPNQKDVFYWEDKGPKSTYGPDDV